jgi:coat protein Gp5
MANDITAIAGKIIARGLLALREQCVMPRTVNFDWGTEVAQKGDTISVPVPSPETAGPVVPGPIPATPQDQTIATVPIALNKWNKADFNLTDKQIGEIDLNNNFLPMQASEAIRSLANIVNADVLANYTGVYGYVGTAGTTPFAIGAGSFANPPTDATSVRKVLNKQLAPPMDRRLTLDPEAEAAALNLPALANFEQTGDPAVKIEGRLGRKFGFDWYYDQQVPTHTKGAAGTALLDDTVARAVGLKTLHMDGFTTKPSVGDVFTIAGDLQTYVVTASTTLVGTDSDVSFEPGLKVAIPAADGNEAVTFKATHVVNLGYHRDAFAFATRPVAANVFAGGNLISQLTDPQTGISLALEIRRAFHMTIWEFSILYGTALIRPALAVRLAG